MRYINVAAASLNQSPLAWAQNKKNILDAIDGARKLGVHVLCCPELCITGYGCEDMFLSVAHNEMALNILYEILPHTNDIAVALGLPVLYREGLYNTACLLVDGKIAGFVGKQHLASSGVHYETRWFKPWPKGCRDIFHAYHSPESLAIGDLIFEIDDVRIGFEICEDAWVGTRTGINLAKQGVDLILNPSASHFAFGKNAVRRRFIQEAARAFHVGYVYTNLLGNEAGRMIYDGDTHIAAGEDMLAEGPRFSFKDWTLTTAAIDVQALRVHRKATPCDVKRDNLIAINHFKFHQKPLKSENASLPLWEKSHFLKEEEFTRAVALGLFDYLRKSKMKGFVLNLSGGADSAACASLVYLMVKLSIEALGEKAFLSKIGRPDVKTKGLMQALLYCLYQRTENNSQVTLDAAESLAKALGASFMNVKIDAIVKAYEDLMKPALNHQLDWQQDDVALQNIQARVRSPGVWLLANYRQALLLCASNRSEAALGYMTMDGDSSGGLCPIAGVDKSFILQWLKWLEETGPEGLAPLPVLHKITSQAPSAELRPTNMHQTDESDLMPYSWLDSIEKLFVHDKHSPKEILKILISRHPELPPKIIAGYIEKFFLSFSTQQWKRERLAPSFHLDIENIDPRSWFRFPILSGGFQQELALMRAENNL